MNRRGFISLLAGAAGAPLVPWRGLVAPTIFLPSLVEAYCRCTSPWCNRLHKSSFLTQESLEEMLRQIKESVDRTGKRIAIKPTHFIIPAVGTAYGAVIGEQQLAGVEIVKDPRLMPGRWYLRTQKL